MIFELHLEGSGSGMGSAGMTLRAVETAQTKANNTHKFPYWITWHMQIGSESFTHELLILLSKMGMLTLPGYISENQKKRISKSYVNWEVPLALL